MTRAGHLVRRFVGSLWPAGPTAAGRRFVAVTLTPEELALWQQMSKADRRHAIAVARRVRPLPPPLSVETVALAPKSTDRGGWEVGADDVRAAALLHDVGKVESRLGTLGRVAATLVGPGRARGRMAVYLRHDEIGARLLADAGARPFVVAWAREHHLPPERWTVPPVVGAALKAADDD